MTTKRKLWLVEDKDGDGLTGPVFIGLFMADVPDKVEAWLRENYGLGEDFDVRAAYSIEPATPVKL